MKHIKKSFLLELDSAEFDKGIQERPELKSAKVTDKDVLKKNNGAIIYVQNSDEKTIGGLVQKINNDHFIFPVPDPTLVYFHSAQINLIRAKETKETLIEKLSEVEIQKAIPIHELYNYYGYSTAVIINLFTALESFLNQQIPTSFQYLRESKKSTEIFNYGQIMEHIDFKTKLTQIIPKIAEKDFMKNQTPTNQYIWNLKEFRDDIVHTKPKAEHPLYEDLMKKSLNFKYDKAIDAVAKLMNYYQSNYIVECDCGQDY